MESKFKSDVLDIGQIWHEDIRTVNDSDILFMRRPSQASFPKRKMQI